MENVMARKENYNGWTNYETWNIALWLDNDQGTQEYWQERAGEAYKDADKDEYFTKEERAALDLSEQLKDEIENQAEDVLETGKAQASFVADLLHSALSEVNWYEIAEHMIEDVDKED